MSAYQRALEAARNATLTVPEFEAIAEASDRDRAAWADEDTEARGRARRWLLAAAALWLLLPLETAVVLGVAGLELQIAGLQAVELLISILAPALLLVWGARLTRDRKLRSAILVRGIASSNLVVALLYAISVGGVLGTAFSIGLAVASGRTLLILGERGLEPEADPDTQFEPTRFRGTLIVALIMAFADALTLLLSASIHGTIVLAFVINDIELPGALTHLGLTVAAAALMIVNVWGLLRLRTWALLSNMVVNVAIALLAMTELLVTNFHVSIALAVTAVIQLLLPVPILAAALGDGEAGRTHARVGALLLRYVVPAMIVLTVIAAAVHVGPTLPHEWIAIAQPRR